MSSSFALRTHRNIRKDLIEHPQLLWSFVLILSYETHWSHCGIVCYLYPVQAGIRIHIATVPSFQTDEPKNAGVSATKPPETKLGTRI